MHAKVAPMDGAQRGIAPIERVARESTRPIRALNRGLEVLIELNRFERAAINTLASAVGLPRTTTYRILETLRLGGYVERDPHDDCYRPTVRVRALAEGFDDEAMLAHLAKPHLTALGAQLVWPVSISTPSAGGMMIRETTDHQSPLALEHYGAGMRLSMLGSAAGRVYLAHVTPVQREAIIEVLARSSLPEDRLARSRPEVERIVQETRAQGYGQSNRARRVSEETSLALAIHVKDRVIAALSVRFAATAVSTRTAVEQFLPKMRETVQKIEREFEQAVANRTTGGA